MSTLSGKSKIWIYQADRSLSDDEIQTLEPTITHFCTQWTAHNQQLKAGYKILYKRFIVLIVDETHTDASGCSIDKSVAFVKSVSETLKTDLFGRLNLAYFENNNLNTLHLSELETALLEGKINENSLFFNTNLQTLEELEHSFLLPLKDHWLGKRVLS